VYGLPRVVHYAIKHPGASGISYPVALFAFFFLVCWCAWKLLPRKAWVPANRIDLAAWLALIPIIGIAGYAIAWLVSPVISDCISPQVAAVAYRAAFYHGQIYGPLNAGAQFSMLYGPITYLAQMPAFLLLGGSLFTAKVTGVIVLVVSLWFVYRSCRTLASTSESIIALGLVCLVLAFFQNMSFLNRPEPILLLCVAVPVWMIATGRECWAFLVTSIAVALAINLKISGVLYLLPAIAFLLYRAKLRRVIEGLSAATVLVVLPFLLPSVSIMNYLAILRVDAKHGISLIGLVECFQWATVLLVLIFSSVLWRYRKGEKLSLHGVIFLGSLAFAIAGACVIGAKPGSGPHHLIPFLGILPHAYFWLRKDGLSGSYVPGGVPVFIPLALTLCLLAALQMERMALGFRTESEEGRSVVDEIHSILHDYPTQSIEMGYGDNVYEEPTYYRMLLVFAGNPYTIDAVPVQELQFGGKELPAASTSLLDGCRTDIWLIPKGEQPFATRNGYNMHLRVFDNDFRMAFVSHYHEIVSRRFFEVWRCTNRRYY